MYKMVDFLNLNLYKLMKTLLSRSYYVLVSWENQKLNLSIDTCMVRAILPTQLFGK